MQQVQDAMAAAAANCDAATNCQKYGDTNYITLPATTLPIMQPLIDLGAKTGTSALVKPIVDLLSPVTRVLIETGYNGNIPYGQPTPFRLIPIINPVTLTVDLVNTTAEGFRPRWPTSAYPRPLLRGRQ